MINTTMSNSYRDTLQALVASFRRPRDTFIAANSVTLGADLGQERDQWMWDAAREFIEEMGFTDTARVKWPLNTDDLVIEFEDQNEAMLYWLTMPTEWH
jgi:hypothetical protein